MKTTYSKLRDDTWGIRVEGPAPTVGQRVSVTKRSGEVKVETVARIVWSSDQVTLCAVERDARAEHAARPQTPIARQRGNWRPCGYPGCRPSFCDECDGVGYQASNGYARRGGR